MDAGSSSSINFPSPFPSQHSVLGSAADVHRTCNSDERAWIVLRRGQWLSGKFIGPTRRITVDPFVVWKTTPKAHPVVLVGSSIGKPRWFAFKR